MYSMPAAMSKIKLTKSPEVNLVAKYRKANAIKEEIKIFIRSFFGILTPNNFLIQKQLTKDKTKIEIKYEIDIPKPERDFVNG